MSLWLTISASAGASFRVPIKKREAFIQIIQKRRLRRRGRPKGENGREIETDPAQSEHGSPASAATLPERGDEATTQSSCIRDKARKD
jgi:hypothetical protein